MLSARRAKACPELAEGTPAGQPPGRRRYFLAALLFVSIAIEDFLGVIIFDLGGIAQDFVVRGFQ